MWQPDQYRKVKALLGNARASLTGVYLGNDEADDLVVMLDELRAHVIACRKHPIPPP